jgi:glycosyltransferase involved in cell wall biosynthesis
VLKNSRLKILHIVSGDLWAGAEAMAYQLLSGLNQQENIDLYLIILNEGRLERLCRQSGIVCHLVDEHKLPFWSIVYKIIRLSNNIKPDIIHSHRFKENIIATLASFILKKPKLVATQHGRAEITSASFPKKIIGILNHTCLRWVFTHVVAVSKDTADYLSQASLLKKNKLSVIPNGINLPSLSRSMETIKDNGNFTIGSAGRLFPVKQFDILIEIASDVCKNFNHVHFVIAGEGPEREKLQALISQNGLAGHVHLLGHIEDMQFFYSGLDLYINTSLHEGTPMSILEAMSNSLPIISFNVAGLKEIISDGVDGFTIPEGNNTLFASRITELISESTLMTIFSKNARKKIFDNFSTKIMVEKYKYIYSIISMTTI